MDVPGRGFVGSGCAPASASRVHLQHRINPRIRGPAPIPSHWIGIAISRMKRKWSAVARLPPFDFGGAALKSRWTRLHCGDCEAFPTAAALRDRIHADARSGSAKEVVAAVQDAWRAFHSGDFQRAFDLGSQVGLPGFAVALKAVGIHATAVEKNAQYAQNRLLEASNSAKGVVERLPEDANAHYLYAYTLGRYGQHISIAEALAQGLAGRIEKSLTRTLSLEPHHADAHTALGVYHSEIVAKLGSLAAGLTYGASGDKAIEHFRRALKLAPQVPVVKVEYAHALRRLDEAAHANEIETLLEEAAQCEPADAMEWLDRERARKRR